MSKREKPPTYVAQGSARNVDVPKGSTRTDLFVTKAPNTVRGRLHRAARVGVRVGQEIKGTVKLDHGDMTRMRDMARRGLIAVRDLEGRGAKVVARLCHGLDLALYALILVNDVDLVEVSDGLIRSLMQLELAEGAIAELEAKLREVNAELVFERQHNEKLREMLAAEQIRNVPPETWEEPTRNSSLTDDQMRAISSEDQD